MRLLLALAALPCVFSLNILIFLIGSNQFERNQFEYLAQQLALRDHNVITVKPILIPEEPRLVKPKLHMVREKTLKNMLPKSMYQPLEQAFDVAPWQADYDLEEYMQPYWAAHNASCHKILNSNLMDTLRKDSLDVAVVYAGNPCLLAITHVLGVPTIYYDHEGLSLETLVAANAPVNLDYPLSHCDMPQLPYLSRVSNALCYAREMLAQSGIAPVAAAVSNKFRQLDGPITDMFATDYAIKKRFPSFPPSSLLRARSDLFLVNTDPLLEYPTALPPHVVPVAGMHIDHPKPLFAPWNDTIASAEEGLIIVSLGTQANQAKMEPAQAQAILGALSKLTKYRIYWRVGPAVSLPGVKLDDVPSHINLTAFIPQIDLIAHKSARLLVTNGGMASIMEAATHGVPLVGIPLYGQNRHNLAKVAHKGLGLVVEKAALTKDNLYKAMKNVLDSNKYKNVAAAMKKSMQSRTEQPFEKVLHAIQHVAKNRGAAFIRPPTANYPLIENIKSLNLELALLVLLVLFAPLYISHRVLKRLIRRGPKTIEKVIKATEKATEKKSKKAE